MFEKLDNRYFFNGELVFSNEMHIGSGKGDGTTDALVMKDFRGNPFIPGSSLRGVLRSIIERIAASLEYAPCLLLKDASCVTTSEKLQDEFKTILKDKNSTDLSEFLGDNSKVCPICRLFGSIVVSSKIRVSDLPLIKDKAMLAIRHGVAINRDTETAQDKAKFDFETVARESRFKFELIGENLTNHDLALLAIGIQEMVYGNFWIGGNTARGLGKCCLENLIIKYFKGTDGLKKYLINKEDLSVMPQDDFFLSITKMVQTGGCNAKEVTE